jgi:hypothetical protein
MPRLPRFHRLAPVPGEYLSRAALPPPSVERGPRQALPRSRPRYDLIGDNGLIGVDGDVNLTHTQLVTLAAFAETYCSSERRSSRSGRVMIIVWSLIIIRPAFCQ